MKKLLLATTFLLCGVSVVAAAQTTQVFTSSGTWTAPGGINFVQVFGCGQGGGGNAGSIVSGSDAASPEAGSGADCHFALFDATAVGHTQTVTIGFVANGGTSGSASAGLAGANSTFGTLATFYGGGGQNALAGTPFGVGPSGTCPNNGIPTIYAGNCGSGNTGNVLATPGGSAIWGAGGGGSAGGIGGSVGSFIAEPGANGGASAPGCLTAPAGGTSSSLNGASAPTPSGPVPGCGGAGGAANLNGTAGNGGNGAYGGGGGAGGAAMNTAVQATGGNGGKGFIAVTSW